MIRVSQIAQMLGCSTSGGDANVSGVSTDTRSIAAGELFVALVGPNFDGHEFVETAARAGAAALLVDRAVEVDLPQLRVRDTTLALGSFATEWRRLFDRPVVCITGSNGKTTTKQMIGAILLEALGDGVISAGNFNNHIGVPLSVLRLRENHHFGVFELGMSNAGEIDYLCRVAAPSVAVVTNAAPAHLEGLGDVESVARAKGEIFGAMDLSGIAVINADDQFADLWRQLAGTRRCVRFALEADAEVTGQFTPAKDGSDIEITTTSGSVTTRIGLPGRHNVMNALAAAAAAHALEIDAEIIGRGLSRFEAPAGRLERIELGRGHVLLNDAYNANPSSMKAAVDVLAASGGQTLLVIGDMAELGPQAEDLHVEIGQYAHDAGIDAMVAFGELSRGAARAFGDGAHYCGDISAVNSLVQRSVRDAEDGLTVLIKGSRSMRMERVVDALRGDASC